MKKFFILSIILIFSLLFSGCGNSIPNTKEPITVSALTCEMFGASTFDATENSVSKRVKASVYPVNAFNKKVDFSVEWDDFATLKDQPVSDYVRVVQDSDGSLEATVTCYKAFRDNLIILKAVSRDGNKVATCSVTYVGVASSISLDCDAQTYSSVERGNFYYVSDGGSLTFNVVLDNAFSSVGSNLSIDVEYFGELWTASGSQYYYGQVKTCTFEKKSFSDLKPCDYFLDTTSFNLDENIYASLVVRGKSNVFAYSFIGPDFPPSDEYADTPFSVGALSLEYDSMLWGSFVDDFATCCDENLSLINNCYVKITVKDNVSGLSSSVNVVYGISPSYITLDNSSLVF